MEEMAKEYLVKLNEQEKKFNKSKYKKEKVIENIKENQTRLAKWEQVERGIESHIRTDEELANYIKSPLGEGTLIAAIKLAIPLIKSDLCKTIDRQIEFLDKE